jgi:hypothetical protein
MGEGGDLGFYMRSENSSLDAYVKTELLQNILAKGITMRAISVPEINFVDLKHLLTQLSNKSGIRHNASNRNIYFTSQMPFVL